MNQSGRASLITILAVAAIILIVGLLAFSRETATNVAARFMSALQSGDVDELTKLTYLGGESEAEMREKWDFTVNTAGRYYYFNYRIAGETQSSPESASVRIVVVRNIDRGQEAYEENFSLPMVKVDDEWKVDAKGISRDLYPALPR